MWISQIGTPVASPNWQHTKLGNDDGSTDGSSDFLRSFDAETDVPLGITNNNDGLETRALTGTGLLLYGFDLNSPVANISIIYPSIIPIPAIASCGVFDAPPSF